MSDELLATVVFGVLMAIIGLCGLWESRRQRRQSSRKTAPRNFFHEVQYTHVTHRKHGCRDATTRRPYRCTTISVSTTDNSRTSKPPASGNAIRCHPSLARLDISLMGTRYAGCCGYKETAIYCAHWLEVVRAHHGRPTRKARHI